MQDVRVSPGGYDIELGLNLHNIKNKEIFLESKDENDLNLILFYDLLSKVKQKKLHMKKSKASDWVNSLGTKLLEEVHQMFLVDKTLSFSRDLPYLFFYLIHLETGKTAFTLSLPNLTKANNNLREMLEYERLCRKKRGACVCDCSLFCSCSENDRGTPTV